MTYPLVLLMKEASKANSRFCPFSPLFFINSKKGEEKSDFFNPASRWIGGWSGGESSFIWIGRSLLPLAVLMIARFLFQWRRPISLEHRQYMRRMRCCDLHARSHPDCLFKKPFAALLKGTFLRWIGGQWGGWKGMRNTLSSTAPGTQALSFESDALSSHWLFQLLCFFSQLSHPIRTVRALNRRHRQWIRWLFKKASVAI